MTKYTLTDIVHPEFPELHRIKATEGFLHLAASSWGEQPGLGGFVTRDGLLSQRGNCWVHREAILRGGEVTGNANLGGHAVMENGSLSGDVVVDGYVRIAGATYLRGETRVTASADLENAGLISGMISIYDNAYIRSPRDLMVCGPIGSENRTAVVHTSFERQSYEVRAGCWKGFLNDLRLRVWPSPTEARWYSNSTTNAREYLAWCDLMEVRIRSWELPDSVLETYDRDAFEQKLKQQQADDIKSREFSPR